MPSPLSLASSDNSSEHILKLLDEPELNTQYLDLGFNGDYWYYGFLLGGKEAIITSKPEIFRNTQEKFKDNVVGENEIKNEFEYEGYVGTIAPLISRKFIKKFIKKELKEDARLTIRDCFDKVKNKVLYYMDFGDQEAIVNIQACWTIATYCYPLFYWFPHLLFNCPSDSGKSKNAFILSQMCFRGFDLGASFSSFLINFFMNFLEINGAIVPT